MIHDERMIAIQRNAIMRAPTRRVSKIVEDHEQRKKVAFPRFQSSRFGATRTLGILVALYTPPKMSRA